MFYGREKELEYLDNIYKSDKAEFIALYGRRRIGKTELLKKFSNDKNHVFYSAKECTDYEQLLSFSERILGKGKRFKDWEALLGHLTDLAREEKTIVIIDEFPYMAKGNKGMASIIQHAWDHELKDSKIKLIICGSSMSFMEKEVLSEKNPLFGRMTGIYKLEELTLGENRHFFPHSDGNDLITLYSILGGVPHYCLQFDKDISLKENILNNVLSKGSVLYNETDFLMRQELREPQIYYTIIEKIALGCTKLNEIHTKTQIDSNKLSVYIKNLIELNIIRKEYPVTEKTKSRINLHSGIYRLANNFFEFYFRFLFPNMSEIEEGLIEDVYEYEIAPNLNHFTSSSYESLCLSYLRKEISSSKSPYRIRYMGRWWNKQEEIDIVGFNKKDYVFGECKWKNSKCDIKVLEDLIAKSIRNFKFDRAHYYLFSRNGFTKELITVAEGRDDVHLVEEIV